MNLETQRTESNDAEFQDGDVLLFWNMPWFVASIINWVSDRQACHHCAVVLDSPRIEDGMEVFEALPPSVQRTPLAEYLEKVQKWSKHWQYKVGRDPLRCEVWRLDNIDPSRVDLMFDFAMDSLGIPYSLARHYAYGTRGETHCSEFLGCCLVNAGLVWPDDFADKRGKRKPSYRWTPYDNATVLAKRGWKTVRSTAFALEV